MAKTFFTIGVGTFLILIYLFLFNQGFEVTDALWTQEGITVNVQNNSSHLIRDIKLYYETATGEKKLIREIDLLAPEEEAQVVLQEAYAVNNRIQLVAEAPYHPAVT